MPFSDIGPVSEANNHAAGPPQVSPEQVVAHRAGAVLIRNTILKSDHFPGCQNKRLTPLLDGAPNFRQVPDLPVYGVAIPTMSGLRLVLDQLGARKGERPVYWQNMREEPVLYVNGRPYVVREADSPFANLEYTGITQQRVEDMEARLKKDVLREAAKYNNHILVAFEGDDFQVIEEWEPVTELDVQTPLEVYDELKGEGYIVHYLRVPVTDEKAPKEVDCEQLLQRIWDVPEGAAIVFNCQMGRGRTTTGMAISSLVLLCKWSSNGGSVPAWFDLTKSVTTPLPTEEEAALKRGDFGVIRSLLRVLDQGARAKLALDQVLDANSSMQNLREAIAGYRQRLINEKNDNKRNALMHVLLEYLERYYVLIAFTNFLLAQGFDPKGSSHTTFPLWSAARPELKSILRRLLRRNPLAALNLHTGAGAEDVDHVTEINGSRVAARSGAVLGPHTILKQDHCPSSHSNRLPMLVQGAPNLREMSGMNVWGCAFPSVEGLHGVMQHIGVQNRFDAQEGKVIGTVWINMREEPVVYINGRPYVLREDGRPFKNLQEYSGIGAERLQQMELRLKEDVLREAEQFEGRVLVAREYASGTGSRIVETHETCSSPATVQTSQEVANALKAEGYAIKYYRVPLTDGTPPKPQDFDAFYKIVKAADPDSPLLFNCQMGVGRTTTGAVIGVMLRCHLHGYPLPCQMSRSFSEADIPHPDDGELEGLSPKSVAGASDEDEEESPQKRRTAFDAIATPDAARRAASAFDDDDGDDEEEKLRNGEYIGVRRFIRILEYGAESKRNVDFVVNCCSHVINLRTAIMRYRTPRSRFRFFRPEINARNTAYKRGISYLERYLLLIAFQAYLAIDDPEKHSKTFEEWMAGRADVRLALDSMHSNPTGALAPVPDLSPSVTMVNPNLDTRELHSLKSVLRVRRGGTLSNRSILKSYSCRGASTYNIINVEGVDDVRQVHGFPVYTLGTTSVGGLRALLDYLECGPSGSSVLVITDVREEMVVYVKGIPYLRREMEMPSAALHHAGVRASKIEDLERRLMADVANEATRWDGKILLHREEQLNTVSPSPKRRKGENGHAIQSASDPAFAAEEKGTDDVTKPLESGEGQRLVAYWEEPGSLGDADNGICTTREVFQCLVNDGYNVAYRRVPLSRERTPEAADIDAMMAQINTDHSGRKLVHVILSRTATGSSCRWTAALITAALLPRVVRAPSTLLEDALKAELEESSGERVRGEYRNIMNLCRVLPHGLAAKNIADTAIDSCNSIGNLRLDIFRCQQVCEGPTENQTTQLSASAARQQGLHYMRRYFLLIAFRCYLETADTQHVAFSQWFADRAELKHLLTTVDFS